MATFTLNEKELISARKFSMKHKTCRTGNMYTQDTFPPVFEFDFSQTGIGVGITITCLQCSTSQVISDVSTW